MALDRRCRLLALKIAVALCVVAGAGVLDARTAATAGWQQRAPAPWCAALGGRDGGYDCGYYTFEQCMATARGLGGNCAPNPRVAFDPYRQPQPQPRRSRK